MITVNIAWSTRASRRSISLIVRSLAVPVPLLHRLVSQQAVQAQSLVRSPITMHPGSHLFVQFLSRDHVFGLEVEFSVLVVQENRFTCNTRTRHIVFLISLNSNFVSAQFNRVSLCLDSQQISAFRELDETLGLYLKRKLFVLSLYKPFCLVGRLYPIKSFHGDISAQEISTTDFHARIRITKKSRQLVLYTLWICIFCRYI